MWLKVELVLDLCFLPGHLCDHVVSVWSLVDSSGEAFAPPMVVEVTFFGRKMPVRLGFVTPGPASIRLVRVVVVVGAFHAAFYGSWAFCTLRRVLLVLQANLENRGQQYGQLPLRHVC